MEKQGLYDKEAKVNKKIDYIKKKKKKEKKEQAKKKDTEA